CTLEHPENDPEPNQEQAQFIQAGSLLPTPAEAQSLGHVGFNPNELSLEKIDSNMTDDDKKTCLEKLQAVVSALGHAMLAAAYALRIIRDTKLYLSAGYSDFNDFCQKTWGFTQSRASQLITSSVVLNNIRLLKPSLVLPETEATTRPLVDLDPPDQAAAWEKALEIATEGDTRVTAKIVQKAKGIVKKSKPASDIVSFRKIEAGQDLVSYEWEIEGGNGLEGSLKAPSSDSPGKKASGSARWVRPTFAGSTPYCEGAGEEVVEGFHEAVEAGQDWTYLVCDTSLPKALEASVIPSRVWLGLTVNSQDRVPAASAELKALREKHPDALLFLHCELAQDPIVLADALGAVDWVVLSPSGDAAVEWNTLAPVVTEVRNAGIKVYLDRLDVALAEVPAPKAG
ncbi:MAG: hypothetical protein HN341_14725, partial [Verrucomicrobia bacterium]|nr:hypothetical protein [Verrucomicrobiota bacterium]